ncbi:MAG TPA: DoxX family protein [Candidatus Binatia bacterium]|jgi:hypothetical protein|nr:DoxX family protein [Candidatus Binatia bacterium]
MTDSVAFAGQAAGVSVSKGVWTGRVLSGLAVAFLTFDAVGKLLQLAPVIEGTAQLGYPESTILPMGVLLVIGLVLYLVPRTSVLGAIFLTGFLGGAVATHVRVGNPLATHTLFPTYVAALLWGGLALRRPAVRAVLLGEK